MPALLNYRYEVRRGGEIVATGRLSHEPLEPGDSVVVGGGPGVVRTVEPILGETELRLVVELPGSSTTS